MRPLETNARIRRRCLAVFRPSNFEREHVNWATKYSKDDNCNRDMSSLTTQLARGFQLGSIYRSILFVRPQNYIKTRNIKSFNILLKSICWL